MKLTELAYLVGDFFKACLFRAWPISAVQIYRFFIICELLLILANASGVVSCCFSKGFEFRVFFLLRCLLTKAVDLSLPCYLTHNQGWGDEDFFLFCRIIPGD